MGRPASRHVSVCANAIHRAFLFQRIIPNLFRAPFARLVRNARRRCSWVLKQVQHDDVGSCVAIPFTDNPLFS
jgi:hypothetical protein